MSASREEKSAQVCVKLVGQTYRVFLFCLILRVAYSYNCRINRLQSQIPWISSSPLCVKEPSLTVHQRGNVALQFHFRPNFISNAALPIKRALGISYVMLKPEKDGISLTPIVCPVAWRLLLRNSFLLGATLISATHRPQNKAHPTRFVYHFLCRQPDLPVLFRRPSAAFRLCQCLFWFRLPCGAS